MAKIIFKEVPLMGRSSLFMLISSMLVCCTGAPDSDSPGLCSLSCDSAVIGSKDFKIEAINSGRTYNCIANGFANDAAKYYSFDGPIVVQFQVYKELEFSATNKRKRMVPAISFHPVVDGILDRGKFNDENVTLDGTKVTPFKWAGITTPKSQWCSDSCGVLTLEIHPVCLRDSDNAVSAYVTSGGLVSDVNQISIKKP